MTSRFVLGTVTFGSQLGEADSLRLGHAAVGQGISFFDAGSVHCSSDGDQALAQQAAKVLGTMTLGSQLSEADPLRLGHAAVGQGISFFDAGSVHCSSAGYQTLAEQVVKVLAQ